jgi:hypothetical protein
MLEFVHYGTEQQKDDQGSSHLTLQVKGRVCQIGVQLAGGGHNCWSLIPHERQRLWTVENLRLAQHPPPK